MNKIGLFGFGCVGQGFYQLLQRSQFGEAIVKKIVVKSKDKQRPFEDLPIAYHPDEIFGDEEIDIIIEAINDADEAFEIVSLALSKRIPVITANKKMVAEHLDELIHLQKKHKTPLLYEAAVCGAIPIINILEEQFGHEHIDSMTGIFNGTSNYILSRLFKDNIAYEKALSRAQELGFAEKDPTSDVGGFDSKYKSIILAKHAYGLSFRPEDIFNFGIDGITTDDIGFARKKGFKIKLAPIIFHQGQHVGIYILPHFFDIEHQLYGVEEEFNSVIVEGEHAGRQVYSGKGAGSFPTAFSLLNDLKRVIAGYSYRYIKSESEYQKINPKDLMIELYVRYEDDAVKDALEFEHITEGFLNDGYKYVMGETSLDILLKNKELFQRVGSSIIATGRKRIRENEPINIASTNEYLVSNE